MNTILKMKFGSELYGTNTVNSDTDIKGIYLPTAREIVLGNYKKTISTSRKKEDKERNTKDDVDTEIFSLDRYLELLMSGQTVALDMLFSPEFQSTRIKSDLSGFTLGNIVENKEKLLTRNILAFTSYAKQQAAKYGIKGSRLDSLKRTMVMLEGLKDSPYTKLISWPDTINQLVLECQELISLEKTPLIEIVCLKGPKGLMDAPHLKVNGRAIPFHATVKYATEVVGKMLDEYGKRAHKAHLNGTRDYKALSHAIRVNSEALELLETGKITFPRPDKDLLLKVKLGELPYEQVAEIIEEGLADLTETHAKSTLRDEPDREWANNLICEVYTNIVKKS